MQPLGPKPEPKAQACQPDDMPNAVSTGGLSVVRHASEGRLGMGSREGHVACSQGGVAGGTAQQLRSTHAQLWPACEAVPACSRVV